MLLAGCVSLPKPVPVQAVASEFGLRLSPASLGRELQLAQRVTVVRDDETRSFEAQFQADPQAVRIAAVAMGQTIASLTWDGTSLEQRVSTHVPAAVTASRILSDVQLAWWPVQVIRDALPEGFRLEEGAQGERTLLWNEAPFASVTYEGTAPAWRHVHLLHRRYGYTLDIESVEASP